MKNADIWLHISGQPLQFTKGKGKTCLQSQLLTYLLTDKTFIITFIQSAIESWHDSNPGVNFYVSIFPSLCTFRKLRKLLRKDHLFSQTTFILLLKGNITHLLTWVIWPFLVSDDPNVMNSPFHGCGDSHPVTFTCTTVFMLLFLPLIISSSLILSY